MLGEGETVRDRRVQRAQLQLGGGSSQDTLERAGSHANSMFKQFLLCAGRGQGAVLSLRAWADGQSASQTEDG